MANAWETIIASAARKTAELCKEYTDGKGLAAYGTCSTAADTAAKVITLTDDSFTLSAGKIIIVKFTYTNTASNPTFNVNGTGAKSVWYGTAVLTTSSLSYAGYASRPAMYVYDGTQYIFMGWSYDANTTYTNVKLGHGYATCSTAAATAAKVATLSSYTLTTGGIVAVKFTNAVPANATLNVNSKGAKAIYYRGAKITAGIIGAGDTATFIYNGSYYHLISIDKVERPNPYALTINGKTYDGSEAVNIEISGGSTSEVNALGQTPLTLTEAANVKLVADGECSYTAKGATVADLSTASSSTATSATLNQTDEYIEFKSTGGAAWYVSHIDLTMGGLTIGEKYRLVIDLSTIEFDATNYITDGHYILKDSGGATLVTAAMGTGVVLHNYEFTATTESVTLFCYPAGGSSFSSGKSISRATDIYINRSSAGTTRTDIINKSGTFTDSFLLGQLSKGITITSTPSCEVYSTSTIGDETTSGATSPLTGKTIVCFGDSLFGMFRGSGSAPSYVAKRTGATVHNIGFGGCRMSVHPTTGYAAFSMWALAKAIAENDWTTQDAQASSGSDYFPEHLATLKGIDFNSVDAIVIHYGTNDFTSNISIDSTSNPTDYNTLCGALRYSVEKLLTAYPHLRIFVSVPAFRYWETNGTITYSNTYTNGGGKTLVNFVEALASVAKEYNLPVIDSYYGLGINKINASTFLADGVHHNIEGRKRFGGYIGSRLIAEY